jgi:hypothetical protein
MALNFPLSFVSGDYIQFSSTLDGYTSPNSVLAFAIAGSTTTIDFSTVADGQGGWTTTLVNSDVASGLYAWSASVTQSGKRTTVDDGRLTVLADLSEVPSLDVRSTNEKILASIEVAIQNYAQNGGLTAFSIEGRSQTFDYKGLLELYKFYLALVAGERAAQARAMGIRAVRQVSFAPDP